MVVEVEVHVIWKGPRSRVYTYTSDLGNSCSIGHVTVGGYYVFFSDESLHLTDCSYTYQPGKDMDEWETARRHEILYALPHDTIGA